MLMSYVVPAVTVLLVMLVLDAVWLGGLARRYYQKTLRGVISYEVRWLPACGFYLLHTVALLVFVVVPASGAMSSAMAWGPIVMRAALLGACTYGTYDLTNMATIRDWPWHLTVVDMLWGMFVTALAGMAGVFACGLLQ